MGKRSRDKGGKGEREAAEALSRVYPDAHRRIGQTRAKHKGADVEGVGPYYVEVEMSARPSPHKKMRQAMRELAALHAYAGPNPIGVIVVNGQRTDAPILVLTRDSSRKRSGPWLATVLLEDWLAQQALIRAIEQRDVKPVYGGPCAHGNPIGDCADCETPPREREPMTPYWVRSGRHG